jgi:isopropylmalate/homocitrate/citramalate synthase
MRQVKSLERIPRMPETSRHERRQFMKPWDIEGKWSISHFGWVDEIRKDMPNLPKKVTIRDVTFREGDDCVGYRVSVDDKLEMLRLAVEMGIEEIDVGGPSMHVHQYEFSKAAANSGIKVRKSARFFANNTKDYKRDIDICVEAGCDNFRIILMYLNEQTIYDQLKAFPGMVEHIHSYNQTISFGMSDIPRASMELINKVYTEGIAAGADKAGVYDTFGVANVPTIKYITRKIREIIPPEMKIKTHCHNTFGLAVANSLACVEGGANEVDTVINGYGDEAGNASLEEVAVALEALYGIDTGLNLNLLNEYSKMAVEKGRVAIQPHKAIVGENAFLRPMYIWAGIDMAKESWMLHEPLSPELVGTESTVVFGPEGSLDDAPIEKKLEELKIPYTPQDVVRVRQTVESMLSEEHTCKVRRPYVSEKEFEDVLRKVMGTGA